MTETAVSQKETSKNRTHRRAERAEKRSLFAAEVERLRDMPKHCPWSYSALRGYVKAGLLRTRKIGGSRCVHRDDWKAFIAGVPDDGADLAEEIA